MQTPPTRPSSRAIARERETDVLNAIAHCGYLTTRLAALWVWCDSSEHVARNKAQSVLKRLEQKRLVMKKLAPGGDRVWILTRAGAEELNLEREMRGAAAWVRSGHDVGFTALEKDKLALALAIELRNQIHNDRGIVGRAGLRAGVVRGYSGCDAVVLECDAQDVITVTGIVAVVDTRPLLVDRVIALRQSGLALEFAGNPKTVELLHKRVRSELRART